MDLSIDIQSLKPLVNNIPRVSTQLTWQDYVGAIKVRWGIGRDRYIIQPGLYKVGNPNSNSEVFVSANYKLSFDHLRKNLDLLDAWILVIDTKGINVWCAAGKGTFGTDNLIQSIKNASLAEIVNHRRIIVPQLGAVGVAAYKVKDDSGFKVIYGPILAKHIKAFIQAGYKANASMRTVSFPMLDRIKVIPVDIATSIYKLLIALAIIFVTSGLDRTGFIFKKMVHTSAYPLFNVISAYLAGLFFAPLFLNWTPFRSFSLKGVFWSSVVSIFLFLLFKPGLWDTVAMILINLGIASFLALNFTGSSTYTSLSGVKKEMRRAIPLQLGAIFSGYILFIILNLF